MQTLNLKNESVNNSKTNGKNLWNAFQFIVMSQMNSSIKILWWKMQNLILSYFFNPTKPAKNAKYLTAASGANSLERQSDALEVWTDLI